MPEHNEMPRRTESLRKDTIWTPSFLRIFIINVFMSMGQFIAGTLLPKYVESLGAPATVIGMVAGMFAITAIAVRPVVGPATGCFRKERLLLLTLGIIITAFLLYGLSTSVPMIMAGRLLHGIGMGFMAPVMLFLASNALPEHRMTSGIGVYTLGQAISQAVGPMVGLSLASAVGYRITFFVSALLMGIAMVIAMLTPMDEPVRTQKFRLSLSEFIDKDVLLPAVIVFFVNGSYACISAFIVVFGNLGGVRDIGMYFTAYAVSLFVSRPLSGRIGDRYGIDKVMIPGFLLFAVSFVLVSFSHSVLMFILSGVVSAFGFGICQPAMQALAMKMVPQARRSLAGNTLYLGVDAGFLLMPALAGALVTFVEAQGGSLLAGYELMYRIMVLPILIGFGLFLANRRKLLAKAGLSGAPAKAGVEGAAS